MNPHCVRLLTLLRERRGVDFSAYRPAAFERRCRSRADALGLSSLSDYAAYVEAHCQEVDALLDALTVKVTSFFRDPWVFELLAHRILPGVIAEKGRREERLFRAWSAGCATGEEAYSIAMTVMEQGAGEVLVLGTDLDAKALEVARRGYYGESSLSNVRLGFLRAYFQAEGDGYRVTERVRRRVTFAVDDLRGGKRRVPSEAVFAGFDLVSCRNVLIYYEKEAQEAIVSRLHQAIGPGGLLVLGEVERLPAAFSRDFLPLISWCPIYRRNH
ncbi:chemotaxis protein methyltransferase CheR [Desulfacinum hydrothermale DSM 13146]|uniref:protein-glutamate O-methyltransferase n=1 Tax=Desulfacinum hydrothermale DSM 13146 TaxID=1121390 RepID=A0A1W1WYJ3_9BACT|nr:protein-glutamate O-methyltransferase CheR [Desulfacinum hydrothermale]SMC16677.1 chemotaxis protein methyltransferase CheR [Desulfacinum hydrothermale DSM 13146]